MDDLKDDEKISEVFPFNGAFNFKNEKQEEKAKNLNILKNKFIIKKPSRVFDIKKEIKLGRPKKNSIKKGKHNKFQKDNLIRRFKAQFIQNIYNYINLSFNINRNVNYKDAKPINVIQKISSYETKSISKFDNIKWLNSKIRDIFSQKVSTKFVYYESNYNNELIKVYILFINCSSNDIFFIYLFLI